MNRGKVCCCPGVKLRGRSGRRAGGAFIDAGRDDPATVSYAYHPLCGSLYRLLAVSLTSFTHTYHPASQCTRPSGHQRQSVSNLQVAAHWLFV